MKRSASIRLMLVLLVLSATVNSAFAGSHDDTDPQKFIAVTADDRAILYWTIQEKVTAHFVVEHSLDGTLFTALDTISAGGNNHSLLNYSYTHAGAASNMVNYYRLKQLNKNGTVSYSHIRVVRFAEKNIVKVEATPNPVMDALQLTVVNDVRLVIKDANNKIVYKKILHQGEYKLNTAKWAAGKYDLSVYENGKLVEKKSLFKFATPELNDLNVLNR